MIQLTIFMEMTAFGQKPSKQDHYRPGVSSLPILLGMDGPLNFV